jgi:hypothetical protein
MKNFHRIQANLLGDVFILHGLTQGVAGRCSELLAGAKHGPGDHHHLAAVLVVKTMRALPRKDVGRYVGDILVGVRIDTA